ncbi:cytosine permease [Burkholderia sp. FERM BP-3421]|uniref:cytosine permease n=1 Tax=Burkholderia sp. FERM BP-3421 TaxID=1494466 RepID=UPI00235F081E|nr:cytosine permease [Burkholderia sp. FERM BP-3421]WDD91862.1 cytosine permease [Burkholderia sp. FERM BP-3421]
MSTQGEFSLSEVPREERKGLLSITMVLLSFTFFTGTMFAGGKIGVAFNIVDMLWIAVIGNLLLAVYAAALALIASRSGLNSVLMGRFCFGEIGSKLSDFLLGFAELGWYAWGTATVAIVLVKLLGWPASVTTPLMVLFGFGFAITAIIGYRGMDALSRVSVPLMFALLVISMGIATRDIGGWAGLVKIVPTHPMGFSAAITMVFGTFASGATQATNWTRLAPNGRTAVLASLIGFFVGNGLMIIAGAYCAIVYQQPDIVEVMLLQGLSIAAVVMLCLNLWTIQGPTIYNVSAAACHLLRTERRRTLTLVGAAIGIVLAIGGMYELLIPFLILLGSIIPPVGGVIMADYWYRHRGRYPTLASAQLPRFNVAGLGAYAIGAALAYASPWIAPIVGIAASALSYVVLVQFARRPAGAAPARGE